MTERKASMGDKVYRGDVIKFIRNNISLGTFMKRTVKTADEACWDLCDKLNYVPAIEEKPEPHWIPVTEEPKKEEKSYWVCLEDGGQCQCRWTNDVYGIGANPWSKWGWKKVDLPQFSKVVAYMPLPEPFNGVTE